MNTTAMKEAIAEAQRRLETLGKMVDSLHAREWAEPSIRDAEIFRVIIDAEQEAGSIEVLMRRVTTGAMWRRATLCERPALAARYDAAMADVEALRAAGVVR